MLGEQNNSMDSRSPSEEIMPANLTSEAKKIWKYAIRRYADEIFSDSRLVNKQWKQAISIFERICKARGITPYTLQHIANKLREIIEM